MRRQRSAVRPVRLAAMRSIRADAVTAELAQGFGAAGIETILLKGPTFASWGNGVDGLRDYLDTDLLVPAAALAAVEDHLVRAGFRQWLDRRETPGGRPTSLHWLRDRDGANVDVHITLTGAAATPEEVWDELAGRREAVTVGGTEVAVLDEAGRALHVALHAAQHGPGIARPLTDLSGALRDVSFDTWRSAADLAARLGAVAAFATGLRLVPEGRAVADALDLPSDVTVDSALRAGTAPPLSLSLEALLSTPGARARVATLVRELFPPPVFMRAWSRMATRGPVGLALSYLWRPFWLLLKLPAGALAVRRARRAARASTPFQLP